LLILQDIKASTDMPDPELQRTLQSLALGKYRILQKAPKGRDVNLTDTFTFNDSFTCPLARFKIMQVVARVESAKEREETQEMVDEERRHQVEVSTPSGAIVDVTFRRVLSGS
jgi:cullin 3